MFARTTNHDHAWFTAGSLSVSTSKALNGSLVFYALRSGLCGQYPPDSSPFIYFALSDWGQRVAPFTGHIRPCRAETH